VDTATAVGFRARIDLVQADSAQLSQDHFPILLGDGRTSSDVRESMLWFGEYPALNGMLLFGASTAG
jgi:hypothetical protein